MTTPILYSYSDLRRLGITFTRQHLWRLMRQGDFPRNFKLNPNGPRCGTAVWDAGEINDHLERLKAARDEQRA